MAEGLKHPKGQSDTISRLRSIRTVNLTKAIGVSVRDGFLGEVMLP